MKISKSFKIYIHIIVLSLVSQNLTGAEDFSKNVIIHEKPQIISELKFKDSNLQDVDLINKRGKIMIINFWATWCAPCKKEMPMLQTMHLNKEEYGIQIIGIAVDHNEPVRDFINEYGIEFPILIGQSKAYEIMQQLGNTATTLPYTVVVEPDGLISWYKNTELKPEDLPSILGY